MPGARDWIRQHLGEGTARAIERVAAVFFGDDNFVECGKCRTPVPANLVTEWGCCPVCREASDKLTDQALLARRQAALAKGDEARKEIEEIERLIAARRGQE